MKYFAEFYSKDRQPYRIEFETQTGSGERQLKLSGNPFVASVKGSEKHIYSPIRCGGATVGLLTKDCIFDLYSGQAQGVKVTLYSGENSESVEWVGYVSPTMYDQGYDEEWEELDIDCVDGIAVLKDVLFKDDQKNIRTFLDIIFRCLKTSGCYSVFFVSDNVQMNDVATEAVVEKFRISTANFFSKKKDISQTDDDVAWNCYDVLYYLCLWLGYTIVTEGDAVYIVDYDAIRTGQTTYHRYSLMDEKPGTGVRTNISYTKSIKADDYAGNGSKINLETVYNKVTVKDDFYNYDNLFPTFGDLNFEKNITAPTANLSRFFHNMTLQDHGLQFGDHITASPNDGVFEDFCIIVDTDWYGNWWLNIFKFYDTPVFNMIKYDRTSRESVMLDENLTYGDLLSYNGAFYYRWFKTDAYRWVDENGTKVNDIYEWINRQRASYNYNAPTAEKMKIWAQLFDKIKFVDKLSLTPVIAMINTGDNRFGPGDEQHYNDATDDDVTKDYPFVTLKSYNSSVFGGPNHYLRIKGTFCFHDEPDTPHKLNNGRDNKYLKRHGDYKGKEQGYLWAKVKWGSQWWGGDEQGWVKSETWFKLYYWLEKDCTYRDGAGMGNEDNFDTDFDFCANGFSFMNLGETGYIIPCPDSNLDGKAEVCFATRDMRGNSKNGSWNPSGTKFDNRYCRYLSDCVFITNLSITAESYEGLLEDADLDSDTLFTDVIENGSVSSMDTITFKVCTDDNKKPSYSVVSYLEDENSRFVYSLVNRALKDAEKGTVGTDGKDACLRQEEHMVFKLASQYQEPRLSYSCELHNEGHKLFGTYTDGMFPGRVFILQEREIDYKMNSVKLKLTEKK